MRAAAYPVSLGLCIAIAAGALLSFSKAAGDFAFVTTAASGKPWTAITYFLISEPIGALLNGFTLWSFGRMVEREIGSLKYAIFCVVVGLLAPLGVQVGSILLNKSAFLAGAWVIAAAIILAWSVRYPRTPVKLMFIAEVEGRWLGLLSIALLIGSAKPYEFSLFTAGGLIFAWAFAANKLGFFPYGQPLEQVKKARTFGRGMQAPRNDYFDDVKRREKEREERERLRKLFEGSVSEEDRKD